MSTTNSAIEWTDSTWNPTRGCSRVSPGCQRCYAERVAARFGGIGAPYEGLLHVNGSWNGKIVLAEDHLRDPIRWGRPRRIFVDSMSDLFHEAIPFEYIDKVFAVMACTTRHTYQILTKRPQRMLEYFARLRWGTEDGDDFEGLTFQEEARRPYGLAGLPDQIRPSEVYDKWAPNRGRGGYDNCGPTWPLVNVWLGVSCENQETADERVPLLLHAPATVRFLSCEPLLGPIDLDCWPESGCSRNWIDSNPGIGWVIVGGESGHKARPMRSDWAFELISDCITNRVPVFFKQGSQANWPDFKNFDSFPLAFQVREYPVSRT